MKNRASKFFDIDRINQNYQILITDFDRINSTINAERDTFDDVVAGNLLHAYDYINRRLAWSSEKDIFSSQDMLELNMIVHLGVDPKVRGKYYTFIKYTEEKFAKYISSIMRWYYYHERREAHPYKIAAGLYVRVLARPQLFSDGNHRTGSLIANYYLLMKGKEPFILTSDNAIEFFNLASDVKFKKEDIWSKIKRTVGWRDESARMRMFLEANAQPFTTDLIQEWAPSDRDAEYLTPRR
jgi:Fic family protein